jgi:hypothetical protein
MPKKRKPVKKGAPAKRKGGPQPDGSWILDCESMVWDGNPEKAYKAPKLRPDVAETAYRTMLEAIGEAPKTEPGKQSKNPDAVARGQAGGKKGGKARAKRMTAEERSRAAKTAAEHRWKESKADES